MVGKVPGLVVGTLPETNSLLLKIGRSKTKQSSSTHPFSGAKMLVSGRIAQQSNKIGIQYSPRFLQDTWRCSPQNHRIRKWRRASACQSLKNNSFQKKTAARAPIIGWQKPAKIDARYWDVYLQIYIYICVCVWFMKLSNDLFAKCFLLTWLVI